MVILQVRADSNKLFDGSSEVRTVADHKDAVRQLENAQTIAARNQEISKRGFHRSAMLALNDGTFDTVRQHAVDGMHALLLGLAKAICRGTARPEASKASYRNKQPTITNNRGSSIRNKQQLQAHQSSTTAAAVRTARILIF